MSYNQRMPPSKPGSDTENIKKRLSFLRSPNLLFWLVFVLLNSLLLLPNFLFNRTDYHFLPLPSMDLGSWQEVFIIREHIDLLRLNAELCLVLAAWVVLGHNWGQKGRTWFWRIFFSLYLIALIYKFYAAALTGLYQMQPNFYNDYSFLAGGLPFFFSAMSLPWWVYPVTGLSLLALIGILWWGTRKLLVNLPLANLGNLSRIFWIGLGILVLVYGWRFRSEWSDPRRVVNSLSAEVAENIRLSLESRRNVETFDLTKPFRTYDYAQYTLQVKPNVYLIFMESYGSVLYTKEHFREPYQDFLGAFESKIGAAGWNAASIFSEAPTWGGGTWISYTSTMFGLPISEQSQYTTLYKAYQQIPYPNMGRYFHTQGYEYIWVSPIQQRISLDREAKDRNFFGVDRRITLESMEYQGPLYGWGPSPPDQYTLGYIGDFIQTQDQPIFLVFITKNTHYPYTPLPEIVADWQAFEEMGETDSNLDENEEAVHVFRDTRDHYLSAIDYTLASLGDFIANLKDPEAVIILMGDHQPPAVSYKGDGYATILHIISQEKAFLDGFRPYGFTTGLFLNSQERRIVQAGMAHESFYSLFVRNLVAFYGADHQDLPPYLPQGLVE
jgi:hypothetical protein